MQNIIVIVYLFAVLVVGILAGRRVTNIKEYAVAGKSFGSMVIFATLSASFIGGGFSMGNAEKVFLIWYCQYSRPLGVQSQGNFWWRFSLLPG